jgi:hypothetical protein
MRYQLSHRFTGIQRRKAEEKPNLVLLANSFFFLTAVFAMNSLAGLGVVILFLLFLLSYNVIGSTNSNNSFHVSKAVVSIFGSLAGASIFNQKYWFSFWIIYTILLSLFVVRRRETFSRSQLLESMKRSNIVMLVFTVVILFSKQMSSIDLWAWQLRGDGINFIVGARNISSFETLFEAIFLNSDITGLTPGQTFLFQWLGQSSINIANTSNYSLQTVGEAFVGIQFLCAGILMIALLHGVKKLLPLQTAGTVAVFSLLLLGPLVGGFTLSNGFLSSSLTVVFIVLVLLNNHELFQTRKVHSYLFIQSTLVTCIFSITSLLGILFGLIILAVLINRTFESISFHGEGNEIRANISSKLIVPILASGFSLTIFTLMFDLKYVKDNVVVSGAFPQIPMQQAILMFVVTLIVLILSTLQGTPNLLIYIGVGFAFLVAIFKVHHDKLGSKAILESLSSTWITDVYYIQKSLWLLTGSILLFLFIVLIEKKYFMQTIIIYALFSFFLISPKPMWDYETRAITSYDGIKSILRQTENDRFMYFNYDNLAGDAYLNTLSGLQFESYTGHDLGGDFFNSTFFMPNDSFSSRSFYTTEENALCTGQRIIGISGKIITRDHSLQAKLLNWCGEGPFPEVIIVDSDKVAVGDDSKK